MRRRVLAERKHDKDAPKREQAQREWKDGSAERYREGYRFVAMGNYLRASERRMKLERYITAIYGCKTSWARVEAHGKYFTYHRRDDRRSERPANGGKWEFNPRTAPLRAPLAA
jgi:hypothetical protein